tara:strand:+ start:171 stop:626 length:456 start_codon:yes stop_codon:yes gene_type:complete
MKNLILTIGILIATATTNIYGQVITVDVVDTKLLMFNKGEDYIDFLYTNAIMGGIDTKKECTYVFDIENNKWNFFKNGVEYGYVSTNSIKEKNGVYTITFKDIGLPPNQNVSVVQEFTIDTNNNYFISAYFDKKNPLVKVELPQQLSVTIN